MRKLIIICILLLSNFIIYAQDLELKAAEIMTQNTLTKYNNQPLILLDFWATWCRPCIVATEQLEILQKRYADVFYAISVSDETHEIVDRFLKRTPINLSVVRDRGGNLFRKYKVDIRPSAVILDTKGNIKWKGHPSDINERLLKRYYGKKVSSKITLDDILILPEINNTTSVKYTEPIIEEYEYTEPFMELKNDWIEYYGQLSNLLAQHFNVPERQIISKNHDKTIKAIFPNSFYKSSDNELVKLIENKFNLKIVEKKDIVKAKVIIQNDISKLWDTSQIDWSNSETNYLIGESSIEADNVSLFELAAILTNAKSNFYYYQGNNSTLYDWYFHYHYDNLMFTELENEFGITFEDKNIILPYYYIEK